ncbi:hypothetical protein Neosp_009734 [[Neocosmospora] mangrovei]
MASPVRLWSLTKPPSGTGTGTVNYEDLRSSNAPSKTPGAFRVVKVEHLLEDPPVIKLYEFSDIRFGRSRNVKADLKALQNTQYGYAAVSHVWEYGAEVEQQQRNMPIDEDLNIDVDAPDGQFVDTKKISWRGLVQIAHAVNSTHLRALKYFWLDFLCIDQVDNNDKEKGLQICIMSSIYAAASAVLVMIGGVPSVQSTKTPTAWMDRAWTLQEAILNRKQWVFIKWSTNPAHQKILDPNFMKGPNPQKAYWSFKQIPWPGPGLNTGEGLYVVKLRHLLDLADAQPLPGIPTLPPVAVLDGLTYRAGDAPRHALRTCLSYDRHVRYTGVWRSMFMRTSSKPVDVVYSIMGIFGISIDPYRKNRSPSFLFNDLARKTAAKARIGPAWMMLSGVGGKANVKSNNEPPKMAFGKRWEWVGYHVDDERFYVPRYDIKFLTHSHPHIINSRMMELKSHSRKSSITLRRYGVKVSKSRIASIRLGSAKGQCTYLGKIPDNPPPRTVFALYIGKIQDMSKRSGMLGQNGFVEFSKRPRVNFGGQHYLLFIKWDKRHKKWVYIADGAWKPNDTYWSPPKVACSKEPSVDS